MRKYIIAISILLCFVSSQAWAFPPGFIAGVTASAPAAGPDPSSIVLWWNAENVAHSAIDYPESGLTWTLASAATLSATAAKNGTLGLYPVGAYDYASIGITANNYAPSSGRYWTWVRVPTSGFGIGETIFYRYIDANNSWKLTTTGSSSDIEFAIDGEVGNVAWIQLASSAANAVENTWYFVEVVIGADLCKIIVNGVTVAESTATRGLVTGNGELQAGNNSGVGKPIHIDTIGASTNQDLDVYTNYKDSAESPK